MANIQAAMPAKFLHVAGANKLIAKEGGAEKAGTGAGLQLPSFLAVLKSQQSKPDALPEGLTGIRSDMPIKLSSENLLESAIEVGISRKQFSGLRDDVSVSESVSPVVTSSVASILDVSTIMVAPKAEILPLPETKSDASAAQQSEIASLTLLACTKPESAIKADESGEAAIAAVAGQTLPQGKSTKASDSKPNLIEPSVQSKRDELASNDATTAFGVRVDASAIASATSINGSAKTSASSAALLAATPTPITSPNSANHPMVLAQPFDQTLRQAETRINATIETPLRSPAFAIELGDKVVWLASRQGQFAELSLNPPQMGALEVRLNLSGTNDASVQFFSTNSIVREAIDAALPRLREMLAQAGINLGKRDEAESNDAPSAFGLRVDASATVSATSLNGSAKTSSFSVDSQSAPTTTIVTPNMASPKAEVVLPQVTESEASALQQREIAGLTSFAGTKTEAVINAYKSGGEAANAAVSGQSLPQGKSSKASDPSAILNTLSAQSKRDEAESNDAPSAFGLRVDASGTASITGFNVSVTSSASPTASLVAVTTSTSTPSAGTNPMVLAQTFDQTLRPAEVRINAAIETPVRSPVFAAELGDKVVWLASRQGQFAELSLNPPQMGALEVRLNLSGNNDASAQFFSPNPIVREAIDAALPRLREMLAQAGINLGEAEVREHAFGRREQSAMRGQNPAQEAEIPLHQAVMAGVGGARSAGVGLVDLYI